MLPRMCRKAGTRTSSIDHGPRAAVRQRLSDAGPEAREATAARGHRCDALREHTQTTIWILIYSLWFAEWKIYIYIPEEEKPVLWVRTLKSYWKPSMESRRRWSSWSADSHLTGCAINGNIQIIEDETKPVFMVYGKKNLYKLPGNSLIFSQFKCGAICGGGAKKKRLIKLVIISCLLTLNGTC